MKGILTQRHLFYNSHWCGFCVWEMLGPWPYRFFVSRKALMTFGQSWSLEVRRISTEEWLKEKGTQLKREHYQQLNFQECIWLGPRSSRRSAVTGAPALFQGPRGGKRGKWGNREDLGQALSWTAGIRRGHRPEAGLRPWIVSATDVNQFTDWGCATGMMSSGKVSNPDGQILIPQDRLDLFHEKWNSFVLALDSWCFMKSTN